MPELALVVFDLSGTIVKDAGDVPEAFTSALQEHGVVVTAEELAAVRGSSKREAVGRFLPDHDEQEHAYRAFRRHLLQRFRSNGVERIEGAERVFGWLKERGVRIAFNTGFERDIAMDLLDGAGWREGVADAVVCGDEVREGRPAPYLIFHAMECTGTTDVRSVANVGDTLLDLSAGKNAGVRWNVGVFSGAHGRRLLETGPHTHLLSSIASLPEVWGSG